MMKATAKILVICLIVATIFSSGVPALAASQAQTTQDKANTLNALKILTGTNGEYNLNNKLSNSEAVTFIVRVLGKGDHVLANKELYSITPFTDVPANQWYAPYVGYCYQNGLIGTSLQFKPSEYMLEKDFLKLVLLALGYKENTDFTYDKVYDLAYELKLISLNRYVNNYHVPTVMTRGVTVDTLFAALNTPMKSEEKKLYRKLIESGVVTAKQVSDSGLLNDTVGTAIEYVKSKDIDTLEVKFNEPIASIGDIKIYSADNGLPIGFSIRALSGDTLTILTSVREPKKEYVIEINTIEDMDGNIVDKVVQGFVGYKPEAVTSDFFRISSIEPVNQRSIKVFFTHPLSINSEIGLYYSIEKDGIKVANGEQGQIKAGLLNSHKNGVLLTLNSDVLQKDALYTLTINGSMISGYGVKLNNGLGDSMRFVAEENEDARFALKEIKAVDSKTLLLSFNKEVNPFLAKQIYNFYVTDTKDKPIRISSTTVDSTGTKIYINLESELQKDESYIFIINNLNDVTKQEYITEATYNFKADYGKVETFDLSKVIAVDNQTLEVIFNKPLDSETASKLENYTLAYYNTYAGLLIDKVLFDPDNPDRVKLFLPKNSPLNSSKEYELRINSNMKDYMGNKISTAKNYFYGTSTKRADITIGSVVPISTDTVKVTFTREIAFSSPNLLPSNYTLEYNFNGLEIKKVPINITYINSTTLVLRFDTLEYEMPYKLKIASILEYTGDTVKGQEKAFELKAE